MRRIQLIVNGKYHEVTVKPSDSLLRVIRDKLGLRGTKNGCNVGECGACTVLMDGKTVRSCLVLAIAASGKAITTIEGLADDRGLHPLQKAFVEHGAMQCGFCTPGMILTAKALLDENPKPSDDQIRDAMVGNLCRCTGYTKIIEAVQAVARDNKKGEGTR